MRYNAATTNNTTLVAKTGEVVGFNPQTWSISVIFYPLTSDDGYDAGAVEVPLQSSWVGNGWGLYCAPALGTEVTVLFANGNLQEPIGLGFIFSGQVNPAQGIQSEECWLVHQSGSLIKLTNDGKITINGNTEIDLTAPQINITTTGAVNVTSGTIATIQAATAINLNAPVVNVSQDIVIANDLSANNGQITMNSGVFNAVTLNATNDVTAAGVSLHNHVHSGVTSGGDDSGPPI